MLLYTQPQVRLVFPLSQRDCGCEVSVSSLSLESCGCEVNVSLSLSEGLWVLVEGMKSRRHTHTVAPEHSNVVNFKRLFLIHPTSRSLSFSISLGAHTGAFLIKFSNFCSHDVFALRP
eukprot:c17103_g1_i1 orf=81-434(+)